MLDVCPRCGDAVRPSPFGPEHVTRERCPGAGRGLVRVVELPPPDPDDPRP